MRARKAEPGDEGSGASLGDLALTRLDRPKPWLFPFELQSPSAPDEFIIRLLLGLDPRQDSNRLLPHPTEGEEGREGVRGGSPWGCESPAAGELLLGSRSTTESDLSSLLLCMLSLGDG